MNKIACYIAAGEGPREKALRAAIAADPRFEPLQINAEIPLDVQFSIENPTRIYVNNELVDLPRICFNAEFKEVSDYVASALAPQGHLYMQLLAAREAGYPCMVVVLGGDNQVTEAILDALQTRYHGKELGFQVSSYESRLRDFEGQCFAMGIPVMRWQTGQYKRLLSVAQKTLCGASLMGYKPRPADGERQTVALCMAKHIGENTASALIAEYGSIANLCTASLEDLAAFKQGGRKIGRVKAESVMRLIHGELPGKHDIHIRARA